MADDGEEPEDAPEQQAEEVGGDFARPVGRVGRFTAGAVNGARAVLHTDQARIVKETIEELRLRPADVAASPWLKDVAKRIQASAGASGKSGALGWFRGHLFERLDVRAYNAANKRVGKKLVLRLNPLNEGYDASRFINNLFAGAVQHKMGPTGAKAATDKLEKLKPGSASKATLRVPVDRLAETVVQAGGRVRVQASAVTTSDIVATSDGGLRQLAMHGKSAASLAAQSSRAAAKSAGVSVAIGGALDVRGLRAGELNGKQFGLARGFEAVEGAGATYGSVAGAALVASLIEAGVITGAAAFATVAGPIVGAVVVGEAVRRVSKPVRRRLEEWAADNPAVEPGDVVDDAIPPARGAEDPDEPTALEAS